MDQFLIMIDTDNHGYDAADVITALNFQCFLGMTNPYDSCASPGYAQVEIPTPANPTLYLGKPILIAHGSAWNIGDWFWFGQTTHLEYASPNHKTIILHAADYIHFLQQPEVQIADITNATADQIIDAVFDRIHLPPTYLPEFARLDMSYELNDGNNLSGGVGWWSGGIHDTGESTFQYVGDRLGTGRTALQVIADAVASEQGVFYQELAYVKFLNRHSINAIVASTTQLEAQLLSGKATILNQLANEITIEFQQRSEGTPNSVLWELAQGLVIKAGKTHYLRVQFRDTNNLQIGGKDLYPPQPYTDYNAVYNLWHLTDATGLLKIVIAESGASGCKLAIYHTSPYDLLITDLQLRGTPINRAVPMTITNRDYITGEAYGFVPLRLSLPLINTIEDADAIANYHLAMRSNTTLIQESITISAPQTELAYLYMFRTIDIKNQGIENVWKSYWIRRVEHHFEKGRHWCILGLRPRFDIFMWVDEGHELDDDSHVLMW